ncbi:MAG: TIR domain-containing protein [Leptolyngbya sp. SIO3F4]|nr:TIR domain-containing protein [Leptolyngbya sp. SIO3F4]
MTTSSVGREFQYDVAFSFAGEQRSYVELVAKALKPRGVRLFYDTDESADLWGKDLHQHLSQVYRERARYCVLFLSNEYAKKVWPRLELKSAQARAFQESREYILPARFDDTEIPGLLPTIAYVSLSDKSPEQFADLIFRKVMNDAPIEHDAAQEAAWQLEGRLAEAVLLAEDYLRPQPLRTSDAIAEIVRDSFRLADLRPDQKAILPYLRSDDAPFRVVGYFAFQIYPSAESVPDLLTCLSRERRLALQPGETRETRPLWQLSSQG